MSVLSFCVTSLEMKRRFPFFHPQGQVEACVKLQADAPEDTDFYVVVQGSALTHVTPARRGADALSLSFIVPGIHRSLLSSQIPVSFHSCGR